MSDRITAQERAAIHNFNGEITVCPTGAFTIIVGTLWGKKKRRGVDVVLPADNTAAPVAMLTPKERDRKITTLALTGMMQADIAMQAGLAPSSVGTALRRLGIYEQWRIAAGRPVITRPKGRGVSQARDQKIRELHRGGEKAPTIGKAVGMTTGGVYSALKRLGLPRSSTWEAT